MLAVAQDGRRVLCLHPGEEGCAERVTGMSITDARRKGLMVTMRDCICFDCCAKFELDLDRDRKTCPRCSSLNVRTSFGSLGAACPACAQGVFVEVVTGIVA